MPSEKIRKAQLQKEHDELVTILKLKTTKDLRIAWVTTILSWILVKVCQVGILLGWLYLCVLCVPWVICISTVCWVVSTLVLSGLSHLIQREVPAFEEVFEQDKIRRRTRSKKGLQGALSVSASCQEQGALSLSLDKESPTVLRKSSVDF
jgi:hypothetical protein